MVGFSTHGRNRPYYYYQCTRQSHEAGNFSCTAPRIAAEALEEAVIDRIRDIGQHIEAREKIVDRAIECLAGESERLKQEEDLVRRQQQKTKADISRLVEVLKSLGAKGLQSVEGELRNLERDEKELTKKLKQIQKSQAAAQRISADAKAFAEA